MNSKTAKKEGGMSPSLADQLLALNLVSKKDYDHHKTIEVIEQKSHEQKNSYHRDPLEANYLVRQIQNYNRPPNKIDTLFDLMKQALLNDYTTIKSIVPIVHTLRDNKILCLPESPCPDPYNVIPFTLNLRKVILSAKFLNAPDHEQKNQITHLFKVRNEHFPPRATD